MYSWKRRSLRYLKWLFVTILIYPTIDCLARHDNNRVPSPMKQEALNQIQDSLASDRSNGVRISSRALADRSVWPIKGGDFRGSKEHHPPSYDIIGASEESSAFSSLGNEDTLIRLLTSSNKSTANRSIALMNEIPDENDFHKNLAYLKKVVKAAKKLPNSHVKHQAVAASGRLNTSSIDEDITTINVLISMLMLANKRLVEQRDLALANYTEKHPSSTKISRYEGAKSNSTSHKPNRKLSDQQSASSRISNTSLPAFVRDGSSKKHQQHQLAPYLASGNSSSSSLMMSRDSLAAASIRGKGEGLSENLGGQQSAQDHVMVRPGFSDRQQVASEFIGSDAAHPVLFTSARPPAAHPSDPMRDHRPIVAHDLLHVSRPASYGEPTPSPALFAGRGRVEPRQRLLDFLGGSSDRHQGYHSDYTTSDPRMRDHLFVPPYNGWTLTARPSPMLQGGPVDSPAPVEQSFPLYPSVREINRPGSGGESQGVNPLEQVIAAAKSQRAAALEYERRRRQHELELQQRQEVARRRHELQLEQQHRQAAQMAENPNTSGGNQLEEPPAQRQVAADQAQQQQQQQQRGTESAEPQQDAESPATDEEQNAQNNNQNSQQVAEGGSGNEEGGEGNEQDANGQQPDLGPFQNFATDDFTDLFPPGILSDAEIREMRHDQEEQRQRQAQEEREKQAEEASGEDQQQQQQPQPEQVDQSAGTNSSTNQTLNSDQVSGNFSIPFNRTQMANEAAGPSKPTRYLPNMASPVLSERDLSQVPVNETARQNKTRRSSYVRSALLHSPQTTMIATQLDSSTNQFIRPIQEPSATIDLFFTPGARSFLATSPERADLELEGGVGEPLVVVR